jgi:hypothetical protein
LYSLTQVIHAVADTPLGPFVKKEVVIPRFAHNPTIKKVQYTIHYTLCSYTTDPTIKKVQSRV